MYEFDDEQPKVCIKFPHGYGFDMFFFSIDEAKTLMEMEPVIHGADGEDSHKIEIESNRFFAIRNNDEFQYYYKPSTHATGSKTSWSIFSYANFIDKVADAIREFSYWKSGDDYPTVILDDNDII